MHKEALRRKEDRSHVERSQRLNDCRGKKYILIKNMTLNILFVDVQLIMMSARTLFM